jgi:hypothetical protein
MICSSSLFTPTMRTSLAVADCPHHHVPFTEYGKIEKNS